MILLSDKDFLSEMGARIYRARRKNGLTQEQLAEKVGVSLQSISSIELGKKEIRAGNLAKLCAALGASADYILLGTATESELAAIDEKLSRLSDGDRKSVV